jgi:hypothetical protein
VWSYSGEGGMAGVGSDGERPDIEALLHRRRDLVDILPAWAGRTKFSSTSRSSIAMAITEGLAA